MSQASCTIANLVFIALLMTGCALAPPSSDKDPVLGHVDSDPSVETPRPSTSAQATDDLSTRLQEVRTRDPERFAQIQRFLDEPDTDVPLNLRKAMREQFEAMLLDEAQRRTEPSQSDPVQLANRPPKKPIVENPRLFTTEPELANTNSADSISPTTVPVKVAEPEETAVQPASHAEPVSQAPGELADRVGREPGKPISASEGEDLTMGQWHGHLSEAIDTLEKELVHFDFDDE